MVAQQVARGDVGGAPRDELAIAQPLNGGDNVHAGVHCV